MIEPIHQSELKNFLRCRLLWFWRAPPPFGLGLEPAVAEGATHFGTIIHEALQIGYDKRTPFAEGLAGLTTDQEQLEMGTPMLEGYQGWAEEQDKKLTFLATEMEWDGVPLTKHLSLAGKFDAVVERSDGLWVMDFKTTSYRTTDWTARDLQATAYIYAARKLLGPDIRGLIFRFLLKKKPLTYNDLILKKGDVTKRKKLGGLTTHYEYAKALAVATLADLSKDPEFAVQTKVPPLEATLDDYAALLDGTQGEKEWYPQFRQMFDNVCKLYHKQIMEVKGPSSFFWEDTQYRTREQIDRLLKFVVRPAAKEMRSLKKGRWIGPTGLGAAFAVCGNCAFKDPCRLVMDGADYRTILKEDYQLRGIYREKKTEAEAEA